MNLAVLESSRETAERALTGQGLMPPWRPRDDCWANGNKGQEWTWGPVAGRAEDGSEEQMQAQVWGCPRAAAAEGQGCRGP